MGLSALALATSLLVIAKKVKNMAMNAGILLQCMATIINVKVLWWA